MNYYPIDTNTRQATTPMALSYNCTAFGQYTTPHATPLVYAIDHTILAKAISCNVQGASRTSPLGRSRPRSIYLSIDHSWKGGVPHLGLDKILFHFKALLWESIILVLPRPPAAPTVLQYYCTTFAQYTPHHHRPPSVCHTPYTIGDGNIVQSPSRTSPLERSRPRSIHR